MNGIRKINWNTVKMDSLNSPTNGIHLPNNRYRNDAQVQKHNFSISEQFVGNRMLMILFSVDSSPFK